MRNHITFSIIFIPFLAVYFLSARLAHGDLNLSHLPVIKLQFKKTIIKAKVVNVPDEWEISPEEVKELFKNVVKDNGVLFVYSGLKPRDFTATDLSVPLSFAFLDFLGEVTNVCEMEPTTVIDHTCQSLGAAKFVLVMRAGWFTSHRVAQNEMIMGVIKAPPTK